jgi:hypothetical protein
MRTITILLALLLSITTAHAYTYDLTVGETGNCLRVSWTPRYYDHYTVAVEALVGDAGTTESRAFAPPVTVCDMVDLAIYKITLYGHQGDVTNNIAETYHCFGAGGGGVQPPTLEEMRQMVRDELSNREAYRIVEDDYWWSGIELVNPTDQARTVILHVGDEDKLVRVPASGTVALAGSDFISAGQAPAWIEGDEAVVLRAGWHRR